ncbi:MAG: WD40 repeat domain-containing protein [Firmicutes bacterium]|nr:WD40 repeat domain-containing protein [Bacillota bacterium]
MKNYGEVLLHFCPAKSPIETMVCTSDSKKLIIGQVATDEEIPTLSVIDIESGKIIKVIERSDDWENTVWRVVIDKKDEYIVYLKQVLKGYEIIAYNLRTEEKKILMETKNEGKYKGFIIGPKNEFVMGLDNIINFYDLDSNTLTRSIQLNEEKTIFGENHCYTSLAFSPDGNLMAVGGLKNGEVLLYDLQTEEIITRFSANFEFPRKIVFDPTGKYLFVLDYWTHGVFIWDLETYERYRDDYFNEKMELITDIDFEPGHPQNIVLGWITSFVDVIDFKKMDELHSDELHKGRVYNVLFTPDGKKLISSGEDWHIVIRSVCGED